MTGAGVGFASEPGRAASFWKSGFLSIVLAALLAVGLAILLAWSIAGEQWALSVVVVLAVPGLIFLGRQPFAAIPLWLLLYPYAVELAGTGAALTYWVLYRMLIPGALGLAILAHWRAAKRVTIRPGIVDLAMLAFLGWTLGSIVWKVGDPAFLSVRAFDRLFVPFCAYWLIRLAAPNEKDLKRLLWVALITLVAQCAISVAGWFAPDLLPVEWVKLAALKERTAGSLGNPAVYSSTLVLAGLLLYHLAVNCRSRPMRTLLLLTFLLAICGVFFTFSRGSWLGALMALAGLILIYPKSTFRLLLLFVLVCSILGISLLGGEFSWAYERLTGEQGQQTAESRLISNNALVGMIRDRPLVGWGYASHQTYGVQYITRVGDILPLWKQGITSHNTYLTIAAELGLPALVIYLFPVAWWLIHSVHARRHLPREGFWSWRLVAVLWLSLLHMFVASNFSDLVTFHSFFTILWWMVLGLIASMVAPYQVAAGPGRADWRRQAPWRTPQGKAHRP
jgi:O-antigen ligase